MKKIENYPTTKNGSYTLKSAVIEGYEYTKTYYKMQDGKPTRCEEGDDSCLTIVNIRKKDAEQKGKKAFVFSEGYIGAEKAYKEDGTKRMSLARKDGFGVSYLIKYIENAEKNNVDNFHVVFASNEETSENQAALYAQALQDITTDEVEKTYIWSHSKAGLLTLRALELMRASGDAKSEQVLNKVKAVLTSMPTQGLNTVDRESIINKLSGSKFLKVLPFSGFIRTGILSFYDRFLYRSTPAQVDLKKKETELALQPYEPRGKLSKLLDKISGNKSFRDRVMNSERVQYDAGYLGRVTSDENLESIKDVNYKVLPVNLEIKDALEAMVKHGQLMPFVLLAKKMLSKEQGDGIVTYSEQGMEEFRDRIKYDENTEVRAGHDIPTTPEALETIGEQLLKDEDENER